MSSEKLESEISLKSSLDPDGFPRRIILSHTISVLYLFCPA